MSNTSPNFGYWRQFSTIKIWNLAAMMNDIDPNVMGDVIDKSGDATDLSDDVQRVISASLVGAITAYPIHGQLPTATTEVSVASLDPWLRACGYVDLADALAHTQQSPVSPASVAVVPIAPTTAGCSSTPISRFSAQETAILDMVKSLGYVPTQLPPNSPGKPGVKSRVKAALGSSGIWAKTTVFSKAWERLRATKEIDSTR